MTTYLANSPFVFNHLYVSMYLKPPSVWSRYLKITLALFALPYFLERLPVPAVKIRREIKGWRRLFKFVPVD